MELISKEYPKINTLYKRDSKNKILIGQYCDPAYSFLEGWGWEATEKIDGTNIRINLGFLPSGFQGFNIQGRTDSAKIPTHLLSRIERIIGGITDFECFRYKGEYPEMVTLYGEGYGAKIQNGGDYIDGHKGSSVDCDFILFDIRVGDFFFDRSKCDEIAEYLKLDIVPIIGYMTIPDAVDMVRKGFQSRITMKPKEAEGLVLKPTVQLFDKQGRRIIAKIKHKDFL